MLVDNDTTSGDINSRVSNYEHGTFQIRNKNPLNLLHSGYWGNKQKYIYEKHTFYSTIRITIFLSER